MWKLFSRRKPDYHLSDRERDILSRIRQGKKNKDIAAELKISEQMVKNRCTTIFLKLGVKNRTQAALKFQQLTK